MTEQTLEEAKQWLRAQLADGAPCPCCTQHAQVYRWSMYSTAVRALIGYYRLGGTTDYVHTSRLKDLGHTGQGDASRLRLWDLVEEEKVRREDGGRAGYWRVTQLGEDWLLDRVTIPKYAFVYNSRLLRLDGDPVTVADRLGHPFDQRELRIGADSE